MNEIIEQVHDEARSAWRFRWLGIGVAAVIAVLGWLFVFTMPDKYEATASVFVDTRTALKPVLQGLTMEQDVNVQLNFVRQSLLSGTALEKIALKTGVLAADVADPSKRAAILDEFSKRVVIAVRSASASANGRDNDSAGAIYTITYQDPSRLRALTVTETLVNTFVEETLGGKRQGSATAQKFLETQIKIYEERLRTAENSLADFKKNNIGLMPTEQGGYFSQLQQEIDVTKKSESDLNVTVSRRAELARQLRGESVITASNVGGPPGMGGGGDTLSRVKEAQARLDDLLLRFTDKHPDVMAARATLAELKQRREAEVESLRRGDVGAAAVSGVSSNPVYQSIQLQLNQADVEIASLRGQIAQHRDKAAELRKRLDTAPEVEARFAQLNRDYDTNKAQYTALLANYEKSRLGGEADNAGSVRFEVVQPPTAGFGPVSLRHSFLLAGVLVAAFAIGGGICYLLHRIWPVVSSVRGLSELTGIPVLGVVSAAFPHQLHVEGRRDLLRFASAAGALIGCFFFVLALNWAGVRLVLGAGGAG